jgi:hypothetical protein
VSETLGYKYLFLQYRENLLQISKKVHTKNGMNFPHMKLISELIKNRIGKRGNQSLT